MLWVKCIVLVTENFSVKEPSKFNHIIETFDPWNILFASEDLKLVLYMAALYFNLRWTIFFNIIIWFFLSVWTQIFVSGVFFFSLLSVLLQTNKWVEHLDLYKIELRFFFYFLYKCICYNCLFFSGTLNYTWKLSLSYLCLLLRKNELLVPNVFVVLWCICAKTRCWEN